MADMTISQALRRIKKLKGQITEHRAHASGGVTHLADQEPAFTFQSSRELAAGAIGEMLALQTAVAVANATTTIDMEGKKVPLALAVRTLRELTGEIAWVRSLPVKAQGKTIEQDLEYNGERHVNVSKTFTCHLPEAERTKMANAAQERFDRLNDLVETINHKTVVPTNLAS